MDDAVRDAASTNAVFVQSRWEGYLQAADREAPRMRAQASSGAGANVGVNTAYADSYGQPERPPVAPASTDFNARPSGSHAQGI